MGEEVAPEVARLGARPVTDFEKAFNDTLLDRDELQQRVDDLSAALNACKAWLRQEEEVGLKVPDILWDIILRVA